MTRLIIADDHKIFREGLMQLFRSIHDIEIEILGEASNGRDALKMITDMQPDIAILDISMGELDGIEVLKKVNERELKTKVILLTMHKDAITAQLAIRERTYGYILKDDGIENILLALRQIKNGKRYISPSITNEILNYQMSQNSNNTALTRRETEILRYIAQGLPNREIAERLHISAKTVETHKNNIMKKAGTKTPAELIKFALRAGE